MNKAVLPVIARLQALQTPSQLASGGARVIASPAHPNPLAALFRELNETILGRSLLVESGNGASLVFEVAGRRILRLRDATGLSGGEGCLDAETLEDEHKDEVLRLVSALAMSRRELRVSSRPLAGAGDGVSVGLPVALIADLARVELNELQDQDTGGVDATTEPRDEAAAAEAEDAPAPADGAATAPRLGRFAAALGPLLIAWLIRGSDEDGASEGPEEMVSHLRGFVDDEAASILAQLDRVSPEPGDAVCLLLGATLVDGHSVICARAGGGLFLGVVEGDATPVLPRAWAEVSG